MSVMRMLLARGALALAALCAAAALLAQGGRWNARLDVLTHFAPVYLAGAVLAALLALAGSRHGRRASFVLAAVAAVSAGALIAPEFLRTAGPAAQPGAPGEIKVIAFNVWRGNPDTARVVDWLDAQHADVIMLEEVSFRLRDMMRARGWVTAGDLSSIMIFTRQTYILMDRPPVPRTVQLTFVNATYASANGPMELVVTHSEWPVSPAHATQAAALRSVLRALPRRRMILAGDFNSTPWSFRRRRDDVALGLIRRDRALATWPARPIGGLRLPFPILPLDHLYAGPGWATTSVARGPALGSDHYPLIVTLAPVGP